MKPVIPISVVATRRLTAFPIWLAALLSLCLQPAGAGPAGWLDARECGASGSGFETAATTTAGSREVVVADPGDFRAGQGVTVSRCNIRYASQRLWGPGEPYSAGGQSPFADAVEIRGYDGSSGSWTLFIIEIDGADPLTFRWSDDLARTWKGSKVPVSYDWQRLSGGTEVRLKRREWKPGEFATFSARDQLVTTIEKIEGKVLTLKDPANRSAADAVVRHCDQAALQSAIDRAIRERRNLYIPAGHYRLVAGLAVRNAECLTIEGADGVNTLLDISGGEGTCFALHRGKEVSVRNFRLVGHTGLAEAAGTFRTSSGFTFWACSLRGCGGTSISGTERVLFENVHASRMASECFISYGPSRSGREEPKEYTRSATYLRCSVTDCAANAFNNCDFAEGTSVLYCRIDGVGWHAYEGSGRFVRLIGNTVRNAGPFTVGDIPHNLPRLAHIDELGVGQAIVANNVFEGVGRCGGIAVAHGPSQVVVRDNLFINYNGHAISASNSTVHNSFPAQSIVISGNVIDLTCVEGAPRARVGIIAGASDCTVSDNQVYVRGKADPLVTGLQLRDGTLNVNVHDNLVRGCGTGLLGWRQGGQVTRALDGRSFLQSGVPLERARSHLYQGWNVVWLSGGKPAGTSVVEAWDPTTLAFRLKEPRDLKAGDAFELYPVAANWSIHDNTITGCLRPATLDCYGSPTSVLKGNTFSRGDAVGVRSGILARGAFKVIGNLFCGFDEAGAAAVALEPDRFGRPASGAFTGNTVERSSAVLSESMPGLSKAWATEGNTIVP